MRKKAHLPFLVLMAAIPAFGGPITITVIPSLAPNRWGSPSWPTYVTNAVTAIQNGLSSYGDPSSPSYYAAQTTPITPMDMIVTGFPSWLGQADPGTVFGPAYANELGNRPQFGVDINGNGTPISISMLSFTGSSNDAVDVLGFSYGLGSYDYSNDYVGIIYGAGGPTFVTSGLNTQLVDRIVGRGSGNAIDAYCSPCTTAQQQAAIVAQLDALSTVTTFTGTYTMSAGSTVLATGSGTLNVEPIPEPGTLVAIAGGLLLTGLLMRRRSGAFANR